MNVKICLSIQSVFLLIGVFWQVVMLNEDYLFEFQLGPIMGMISYACGFVVLAILCYAILKLRITKAFIPLVIQVVGLILMIISYYRFLSSMSDPILVTNRIAWVYWGSLLISSIFFAITNKKEKSVPLS